MSRPLTVRETQVLALVAHGYTNAQIGAKLNLAPGTIKTHLTHIADKASGHARGGRAALVAWGIRQGLI